MMGGKHKGRGFFVPFLNNWIGGENLFRQLWAWIGMWVFCPVAFGLIAISETVVDQVLMRWAVAFTALGVAWFGACFIWLGPFYLVFQALATIAIAVDYFQLAH